MDIAATARLQRLQFWLSRISNFLAGQGAVQILNFLVGFLLLRWLSVESYAQYSVAFGFQATLGILVDLGFSSSIVAMVGNRGNDPQVVGSYIRSAKYFRNRLYWLILPVGAIAFPLVVLKQHWPWHDQLLLFVSIAFSLYAQGLAAFYSAPLLIAQRLKPYYTAQLVGAAFRLLGTGGIWLVLSLSAWQAAWISAISALLNAWLYIHSSKDLVHEPAVIDPKINRELVNYFTPLIPSAIFFAIQGQISVLIISVFGHSTSVAEIGALGRLGQLFVVLGAFNSVVISPYIAKVPRNQLLRRYLQIVSGSIILAASLVILAFAFPEPLLWLLGPKYANLRTETSFLIFASTVQYLVSVLWTIHYSRKWIYLWGSVLFIIGIISTQIAFILFFDLSHALNIIYLSLCTASAELCVQVIISIYSFVKLFQAMKSVDPMNDSKE
jgi:O-antigen/teichoic acid export membrane protein